MSSRSVKQRETLRNRTPAELGEDSDAIEWRPDWGKCCDACGQTPCMFGVSGGVIVIEATQCADCLDDGARLAVGSGY
ncbi:hypothetical protein PUN4_320018 [Paraburkholderia unamae]|uniref:hypothetical protein n=1 Tax=Paraburkholderia unamae TaxID=219649 RepID=UPI001CAD92E9|nr:hypothetical protein [Paraburkholderia unamae]CAG9258533.1 hypothetical protein PUN4_320018 [Paraburkholderia unamae]